MAATRRQSGPALPKVLVYQDGDDGPLISMEMPKRPGWACEVEMVRQGDAYIVGRCSVRPREPGRVPEGGVTALVLRDVPLGAVGAVLTNGLSGIGRLTEVVYGAGAVEALERAPRTGPKGHPDLFYAQWAARYVEACGSGSSSPITDLAEEHSYSPKTVREYVRRARQRGLLTGTTAGRSGGQLTAAATTLLAGGPA